MSAKYTVSEFVNLVSEMREIQTHVRKMRDKRAISMAVEREKLVDAMIDNAKSFGFKEE